MAQSWKPPDSIDTPTANVEHYDFHGVRLSVGIDNSRLADDIRARLRIFAATATSCPDVLFQFARSTNPWPANVPSDTRPVYDGSDGQVLYSDENACLLSLVRDRIYVHCDCVSMTVEAFYRSPDGELSTADRWFLSHPMLTLPLIELLRRRSLYNVHASCASLDGRAILLPGSSGSGKSTLAIALVRDGFEFQGDDMNFLSRVEDGLMVRAYPDEIDIGGESAMFLPELSNLFNGPRRTGWPKHTMCPDSDLGAQIVLDAQPTVVAFPVITGETESRLERIEPNVALMELLPNVLLTDPTVIQAHIDALNELVETTPCFRLFTGTNLRRAASLLRSALGD